MSHLKTTSQAGEMFGCGSLNLKLIKKWLALKSSKSLGEFDMRDQNTCFFWASQKGDLKLQDLKVPILDSDMNLQNCVLRCWGTSNADTWEDRCAQTCGWICLAQYENLGSNSRSVPNEVDNKLALFDSEACATNLLQSVCFEKWCLLCSEAARHRMLIPPKPLDCKLLSKNQLLLNPLSYTLEHPIWNVFKPQKATLSSYVTVTPIPE